MSSVGYRSPCLTAQEAADHRARCPRVRSVLPVERRSRPELPVQLEAPDPRQVVAPRVEEDAAEQGARRLHGRRIARPEPAVDLHQRLVRVPVLVVEPASRGPTRRSCPGPRRPTLKGAIGRAAIFASSFEVSGWFASSSTSPVFASTTRPPVRRFSSHAIGTGNLRDPRLDHALHPALVQAPAGLHDRLALPGLLDLLGHRRLVPVDLRVQLQPPRRPRSRGPPPGRRRAEDLLVRQDRALSRKPKARRNAVAGSFRRRSMRTYRMSLASN